MRVETAEIDASLQTMSLLKFKHPVNNNKATAAQLSLAFLFLSPPAINYRERPQETNTAASEVLVKMDGVDWLIYEIGAGQVDGAAKNATLQAQLLQRIETISGPMRMDRYSAQKDAGGRVTEYRIWAHR